MKKISIHQPQYFPWLPYIDKILLSDEFIFLDDVQFQKNGLQNRNQIKGPQGPQWLTLPIKKRFGQLICDSEITEKKILNKHLKTLEMNYVKAPYFWEVFDMISEVFNNASLNLSDICCKLITRFLQYLDYNGNMLKSSQICTEGKGSGLILDICKERMADEYISGQGGKAYLRLYDFDKSGIKVHFQKFDYKTYRQCFPKIGFCKDLSIVDLLFNEGKNSRSIIESGRF